MPDLEVSHRSGVRACLSASAFASSDCVFSGRSSGDFSRSMVCRVRSSLLAAAGMVFLRGIEVYRNMLNKTFWNC